MALGLIFGCAAPVSAARLLSARIERDGEPIVHTF